MTGLPKDTKSNSGLFEWFVVVMSISLWFASFFSPHYSLQQNFLPFLWPVWVIKFVLVLLSVLLLVTGSFGFRNRKLHFVLHCLMGIGMGILAVIFFVTGN